MMKEVKKKLSITIIVSSILTIIFALVSINSGNIYVFRILTQVCIFLTMLLSGVNCFVYQKQKVLGSFIWLVSAFILFVIADTIFTSMSI